MSQKRKSSTAERTRFAPRRRARRLRLAVGGLLAAALVTVGAPADAGTTIPRLPQTTPAGNTPRVVDDSTVRNAGVRELHQIGRRMYVGGDFHRVTAASGSPSYVRNNIFAFNRNTGAVINVPNLTANRSVYAIEPSADGRFLYVGGDFTTFGGRTVNNLVKFNLKRNRVVRGFTFPVATGRVSDLQLVGGRLFVAGNFPGGIVAVNPNTGALTHYLDGIHAAGGNSGYTTRVYRFSINPARNRMVVIGSFQTVGGQNRQQVALVNLGATSATVSPWFSDTWNQPCSRRLLWYSRDVDWSPDGSYFVVVTTGAGYPNTFCDAATAWAPVDAPDQQPLWTQFTGGDTFHSVTVTDKAVFVGGHFRWLDNPDGHDSMGPGAVRIQGLGALDPDTGRAIRTWNPTKSIEGGLGAFDLYFTGKGLWIGHFEQRIGHESHPGLGRLPF